MSNSVENIIPLSVGVSITSSATVATGGLETINHYAPVIGICLSVLSIALGLAFFVINHKRETLRSSKYLEDLKHSLKEEIITEMMKKGT